MPIFSVRLYLGGIWDQGEPRPVEAEDARMAAELASREPLLPRGCAGQLRAEVWPESQAARKRLFYRAVYVKTAV